MYYLTLLLNLIYICLELCTVMYFLSVLYLYGINLVYLAINPSVHESTHPSINIYIYIYIPRSQFDLFRAATE